MTTPISATDSPSTYCSSSASRWSSLNCATISRTTRRVSARWRAVSGSSADGARASDTAPVREMVRHEHNGLLADFFDVEGFAAQAGRVLDDPAAFRPLGLAGVEMIRDRYSLEVCLPRMLDLYEEACHVRGGS